jgi:hypothetical protein
LIERVGIDEYNRLHAEHLRRQTVATMKRLRDPQNYLTLFTVADKSFYTLDQATKYARKLRRLKVGGVLIFAGSR